MAIRADGALTADLPQPLLEIGDVAHGYRIDQIERAGPHNFRYHVLVDEARGFYAVAPVSEPEGWEPDDTADMIFAHVNKVTKHRQPGTWVEERKPYDLPRRKKQSDRTVRVRAEILYHAKAVRGTWFSIDKNDSFAIQQANFLYNEGILERRLQSQSPTVYDLHPPDIVQVRLP